MDEVPVSENQIDVVVGRNNSCPLRIYCCTWNVAQTISNSDLTELLRTDETTLPDVYAVGFQEVDIIFGSADSHVWTSKLTSILSLKGYTRIKSVMLQGLLLNVFVKRDWLPQTYHIESEYTRTGFAGLWGNKGGVSIRMDIGGINLCFVNCHLAAHQDDVSSRIEDFSNIVEDQSFSDEDVDNILDHDYIFWLGDMNFRIDEDDRDHLISLINQKRYEDLWPKDQLTSVRQDELAFINFEEGLLKFDPTYKFDIGTNTYDTSAKKRLPAWCDRVLWMKHDTALNELKLKVSQLCYTSIPSYTDSDHKPVVAIFDIEVFAKLPIPADITFMPVNDWRNVKDAHFTYSVAENFPVSSSDWIALFSENFNDFYNYSSYVYSTGSAGNQVTQQFPAHKVKGKLGKYRLCYFNSSDALLGSSDAFEISIPGSSVGHCCYLF